jgi:hypothetical protein
MTLLRPMLPPVMPVPGSPQCLRALSTVSSAPSWAVDKPHLLLKKRKKPRLDL